MIEVDLGDRKYVFYSEIRAERDNWFECIKTAWKNSKEIKASISKMPRNLLRLQRMLETEGIGTVKNMCIEEIEANNKSIRNV